MPKHYFRKEIPQNPVRDTKGEKIPFIPISQSIGFIELDDSDETQKRWIYELEAVMKARKYGVSRLDEAQYADMAQKKTPLTQLPHWLGGRGGDGRDEISSEALQKSLTAARENAGRAAVVAGRIRPEIKPEPTAATPHLHIDPRPPVGRLKPAVKPEAA